MKRGKLKEEKELLEYIDVLPPMRLNGRDCKPFIYKRITALIRAVRKDERGKCGERAFAKYLAMFGDSHQNIQRAGQIVAAIREGK